MNSVLRPICGKDTRCKCCGAAALLYGVVDFHKDCHRKILAISGVPVYYYRCSKCRFVFTTAFDDFTTEDFRRYIYNDDYAIVDPGYQKDRPQTNAVLLGRLLSGAKPMRILDYGGGNGLLAEALRAAGFSQTDTYDPFVPRYAARPPYKYDCVVSFEVAEHSTDPLRTFADMNGFLTDPGLILFSTLLQPATIDQQGLNWWYAAPRNGHVSLYSRTSLEKVVQPFGLKLGSFSNNLHVLFREVPEFAKRFLTIR